MKCDKIGELLSPYLDQMTSEKESKCVEAHIASCPKCRLALEQLRKMCHSVHELEVPEVPETFIKDLHQRLANENLKYFGEKHIRTPQRPGWIAAGVAGVALAAGIFASSFLPFGSMIANFENKSDRDKLPSSVAIDNILDNVKSHLADKNDSKQPNVNNDKTPTVASVDKDSKDAKVVKPGVPTASPGQSNTVTQPSVTDVVNTSVKVADIGSSVQKVMAIAGDNGGQYTALPASAGIQAFSSARTKAVSIKVDPENADKVLTELNEVGITATPEYNKVDVSSQYNEVNNNINDVEAQISKLEAAPEASDTDKAKLNELNNQLFQYKQKMELLKRTIINIYLVEENNQ